MRRLWVVLVAVGASACILPSPDYDGTAFSCAEPPFSCPSGQVCEQGVCIGDPIAPDPGGPDAATPVADQPDAEPTPTEDPPPDAAEELGDPTTVTLGERPGADIVATTRDNTIDEENPLDNNGGDEVITPDIDPNHRGLLFIDTSAIPPGAQVIAAELELYVSNPIEEVGIRLHQLLEDWNENQSNWRDRRNNQRWTSAGAGVGSHAAEVMGTLPVGDAGPYTVPLDPAVVQQWVSAPSTNYGILWISGSTTDRGAEIETSESDTPAYRPLLRITYR